MPGAGIEPARPLLTNRRILSPLCLPISPSGRLICFALNFIILRININVNLYWYPRWELNPQLISPFERDDFANLSTGALYNMAGPDGVEPPTAGFEDQNSIQLS